VLLPDPKIREELLRYTPPGMPIADVLRFTREQLHSEDSGGNLRTRYSPPSAQAHLGHYYNPINLIFPTYVLVVWVFDKRDRVRDIRVDRYVEGW
jgi:hypothetical protein